MERTRTMMPLVNLQPGMVIFPHPRAVLGMLVVDIQQDGRQVSVCCAFADEHNSVDTYTFDAKLDWFVQVGS